LVCRETPRPKQNNHHLFWAHIYKSMMRVRNRIHHNQGKVIKGKHLFHKSSPRSMSFTSEINITNVTSYDQTKAVILFILLFWDNFFSKQWSINLDLWSLIHSLILHQSLSNQYVKAINSFFKNKNVISSLWSRWSVTKKEP